MVLKDKTILVTGASSGIGYAIVEHLAKQGYCVLATVRKEKDVFSLNQLGYENLKPVCPLDLRNQEQISYVAQSIIDKIQNYELPPLYAIVFNAGGGHIAPIELMNVNDFRDELEIRLVGTISLLQKFIPLLRQTKGRVFWISTSGLLFCPPLFGQQIKDCYTINFIFFSREEVNMASSR